MSFIAPAGTPLSLTEIACGLSRHARGALPVPALEAALSRHAQERKCWTVASGRAAMTIILKAAHAAAKDPRRNEVIVAGYTCYSVPASVHKAGLRPRLCDIDPRTLSLRLEDMQRFDWSRVLAIVSANLYGIPNDLTAIERFASERGVLMLDDSAQSLGARIDGRSVGAFGDAGLYSFDKGKNITTMQGGAIVARPGALHDALEHELQALPPTSTAETATLSAKLVAYSLLLRPTLYGAVRRMPFLGLGRTMYDEVFPVCRFSPSLAGLALHLFGRLQELNAIRRRNAESLAAALADDANTTPVQLLTRAEPVYARFPLLVRDPSTRSDVIAALENVGIGATASYPNALCDVPEVRKMIPPEDQQLPGARLVAESIVTLPTHPYCPADLAERTAKTLGRSRGAERAGASMAR